MAVLLFGLQATLQAQPSNFAYRYINRLVNDTSDISRPQLLMYPALSYAPETRWELGLSCLYVYYSRRDTANRLNEIKGYTFYTLENQYGFWLNHAIYTHQNKWTFLGRMRLQYFPLLYFGIGPGTDPDYLARVNARQIQLRERVLFRAGGDFYIGPGADFHKLSSVRFQENEPAISFEKPFGYKGSANIGLGATAIYDTRRNIMNVRNGVFAELSLLRYAHSWASDFTFTSLLSDNRFYMPINNRDVLAGQLMAHYNRGDVPFNMMSLMGGENLMRGYYLGRYRDKNQVAAQLEYRFLPLPLGFSKRWGAAVFGSTGTVSEQFTQLSAKEFVWAGGAGLRFLIFPKKDVFSRLDFAMTKEGPGFYIFIGEAF